LKKLAVAFQLVHAERVSSSVAIQLADDFERSFVWFVEIFADADEGRS